MVVSSTSGSLAMVVRVRKAFSSECEKAPVETGLGDEEVHLGTLIQDGGVVPSHASTRLAPVVRSSGRSPGLPRALTPR
eukprot:5535242-Prymnesium_polylepis.1